MSESAPEKTRPLLKGLHHPAVRIVTRRFWGTVFTLIITFAVFVQLGRQAFPLLQDYQQDIVKIVERSLGVNITVEKLEATWSGLRPKIILENVYVSSTENVAIFKVGAVTAELNLIHSILNGRFTWRQLLFSGFDARMVQDVEGRWAISGMENFKTNNTGKENFKFDDPYDLFLFGRRIVITDANFHLNFQSGERTTATVSTISIENDRDFHRLLANIDIDDGQRILTLIVEGDGDPRNENFVANGYLELNRFSTHNIIETFALHDISLGSAGHTTDMKLWFRSDHQKGTTLRGSLHAQGHVEHKNVDVNLPDSISADFHGKAGRKDGWRITMQDFVMAWPELQSPESAIGLYGDFRGVEGLRIGELDLEKWRRVVERVGIKNEDLNEAISSIRPRGTLRNMHVSLLSKDNGYFRAQAQVENVSTQAFMGAPAFSHVDGYVELSAFDGKINVNSVDGFVIDLSKVYNDPMVFDQAQGQVRWKIDMKKRIAYLSSGVLSVSAGDESANGYLNMTLPFAKQYGEQEMTLVIGLKKANALSHKKYVPKTIPNHLYNWLDKSIKKGVVSNVSFLYHGSVQKDPEVYPTVQLVGNVSNTSIVFDEKWPMLQEITGELRLDNNKLDVHVDQAVMQENNIFNAQLNLIDNPKDKGKALLITGESASDVNRAMSLINKSPLRENIGNTFDNWKMEGDVSAKLRLIVPLDQGVRGDSQKVDISIQNGAVDITDLNLQFNALKGNLHYYSEKGLFSDGLQASLWGRRVNADLSNPKNSSGSRDIVLDFSSNVDVKNLNAWLKRPELDFARGVTSVSGTLYVPGTGVDDVLRVSTRSNLAGLAIDLPAPLGKTKTDTMMFTSSHMFYDGQEELRLALGDQLDVALLLPHKPHSNTLVGDSSFASDSSIAAGNTKDNIKDNTKDHANKDDAPSGISAVIYVNQRELHQKLPSPIANTQRFDIDGSFDVLVLDEWLKVKDRYFEYASKYDAGGNTEGDDLAVAYNVDIGIFNLNGVEVENLSVTGERKDAVWEMAVASTLLAGNVRVPEDDNPIALDLQYLRLVSDEENKTEPPGAEQTSERDENEKIPYESVLADVDLNKAIPLLFSTQEFSVGDDNYGAWSFMLTPIDNGVELFNIVASSRGLQIGQSGESASLLWMQKDGEQSTQFKGDIYSSNLAKVFESWGQEKLVYSKSARFAVNARWPGAPDEVALKTIEGIISLDLKNGSFSRAQGSDENALLRLIALFNFDTLLRRLRLDFSDLAAQGYAFDSVTGNFDFRDGKVFLTEPLIVKSSSSNLQLAGIIGMIEEDVDAEVVVTLPVASNVALATALVVNLPAALGVYVMSKLFKKQLDKASSVTIDINGDWEDPKVKIKKIFDTEGANKKGQQVKDENFTPPSTQPLDEK